jgi:plastocyanin domain-containing protein
MNTETRTVTCEPAHISPRLSGREYGWRRTQAMTQQFTRIPRWLTNDLLVIVVGMAIIGALAWIAPF